jgi:hypothetical protein
MTDLAAVEALLKPHHLAVMGGFHAKDDASLPKGAQTLLLIGPAEPRFWPHLKAQPEWQSGAADPIDRWSRRVIGEIAYAAQAEAIFPFGGAPWHPFYQWALRSGRAWDSPVRLLVHDQMGLFASYRGALALRDALTLPPSAENPCDTCATKPCLTACPVQALSSGGYDLAACHDFLDKSNGADCMNHGCNARRACPVSQAYARLSEQSAFHMRQFHK